MLSIVYIYIILQSLWICYIYICGVQISPCRSSTYYQYIACAKKMANGRGRDIYLILCVYTIKIKPRDGGQDVNTKSSVCTVNDPNKMNEINATTFRTASSGDSCANVALGAYSSHNTLPDFLWCPPDVLLCPGNTRRQRQQQQQPHPPSSLHHHLYGYRFTTVLYTVRRREEKNLLKKEEKKLRADDSMTVSAAAVLSDFNGAQRIRNRSLGSGGS